MKKYFLKLIILTCLYLYLLATDFAALFITIAVSIYVLKKDIDNIKQLKRLTSLTAVLLTVFLILRGYYEETALFLIIYTIYNKLYAASINKIANTKELQNFIRSDFYRKRENLTFIYYLAFTLLSIIVLFIFRSKILYLDKYFVLLIFLFPINNILNDKLSLLNIYLSTKNDIKYKDINALYKLFDADTFVFDKSKTVLNNDLKISAVVSNTISSEKLLNLVAALEKNVPGDIAEAIKKNATKKMELDITNTKKLDGGYQVNADGDTYLIGDYNLMEAKNIDAVKTRRIGTNLYIAKNDKFIGLITLNDNISKTTKNIIKHIREYLKKDVLLLSGDNFPFVKSIASKLGVNRYIAEVNKEDKVKYLKALDYEGEKVCFVGSSDEDDELLKTAYVSVDIGEIDGYDIDINSMDDLCRIMSIGRAIFKRRIIHAVLIAIIRLLLIALYLYRVISGLDFVMLILFTILLNSVGVLEPTKK